MLVYVLHTNKIWAYLEVLSNLAHEPLEGELADEQLGGLLVPPDFTEGDCTRSEAMRLLYTSSSGGLRRRRVNESL
jgi:hypothetical protein